MILNPVDALNKVAKWRTIFAGWQLGTRPKGDPECDAVRDHRELSIILRVENSALVRLLLEKGLITREEWDRTVTEEAMALEKIFERRFPGIRAIADGIEFYDIQKARETMKGWRP